MKNQALFSSKDKSRKLKCCLLQFLLSAIRANNCHMTMNSVSMSIRKIDDKFLTIYNVCKQVPELVDWM